LFQQRGQFGNRMHGKCPLLQNGLGVAAEVAAFGVGGCQGVQG
jgi:hypothetical protein